MPPVAVDEMATPTKRVSLGGEVVIEEKEEKGAVIQTKAAEHLIKSRYGAFSDLISNIELDYNEDDVVVSFHCNYKQLGLQPGVLISVTGSPRCLGAWDVRKSIPINEHGGLFIHVSKTLLPFEFKFIIRKGDRILWQKGPNFAIGHKMPDRFNIYAQMYMGEVTDKDKKPVTFNDYSWHHYAWALTNGNACEVTIEADHMYLDPSCRMRRLLDKAMKMIENLLYPDLSVDEDELDRIRNRLGELMAQIALYRPFVRRREALRAADGSNGYVEMAASAFGADAAHGAAGRGSSFGSASSSSRRLDMALAQMNAVAQLTGIPAGVKAYRVLAGESRKLVAELPPDTTTYTARDLPVGSHSFVIVAVGNDGRQLASSPPLVLSLPMGPGDAARAPKGAPGAPVAFAASATAAVGSVPAAISLEWRPPASSGGAALEAYEIHAGGTKLGEVSAAGEGPRFYFSATAGRLPGEGTQPLTFTVSARNKAGVVGPASAAAVCVPIAGDDPKAIPASAFDIGTNSATLLWAPFSGSYDWKPLAGEATASGGAEEEEEDTEAVKEALAEQGLDVGTPSGKEAGMRAKKARAMGAFKMLEKMVAGKEVVVALLLVLRELCDRIAELEAEVARLRIKSDADDATIASLREVLAEKERELAELRDLVDQLRAEIASRMRPAAPTGLRATDVTPTSAMLEWAAPGAANEPDQAAACPPVLSYELVQGEKKVATVPGPAGTGPVRYRAGGLEPAKLYAFAVRAVTKQGAGPLSTPVAVSTPPSVPGAPKGLRVEEVTPSSATVSWEAPKPSHAGDGADVDHYDVLVNGEKVGEVPAGAPGRRLEHTAGGLEGGKPYFIQVRAVGKEGAGPLSTPACITTPADIPGAPTALHAVHVAPGEATLEWLPPAAGDGALDTPVLSYIVHANGKPVGEVPTAPGSTAKIQFIADGLESGLPHSFTVQAVGRGGPGPHSLPACVVIPTGLPGQPLDLKLVDVTCWSADLEWRAPIEEDAPAPTHYDVLANGKKVGEVLYEDGGPAYRYRATGLDAGSAYAFTVQSVNDMGPGQATSPVFVKIPSGIPGAPVDLRVAELTSAGVTLEWEAPAESQNSAKLMRSPSKGFDINKGAAAAITSYVVHANGRKVGECLPTGDEGPVRFKTSALQTGVPYAIAVQAVSKTGFGPLSFPVSVVVPCSCTCHAHFTGVHTHGAGTPVPPGAGGVGNTTPRSSSGSSAGAGRAGVPGLNLSKVQGQQ